MKRFSLVKAVALFMAVCTLLSCAVWMTACGGEKDPEAGKKDPEPPATDPTVTDTDTEDPVPPVEPTDPVDPAEPQPGEDEEPEFEMIKLKSPLKVFGGKHPYGVLVEDSVDKSLSEQFVANEIAKSGAEIEFSFGAIGAFREDKIKTPKILIGNMNTRWTASAREKMGDANWIISVEEKHIVLVGRADGDVENAMNCLYNALDYYTAHTGSEEMVLPNDFCVTSKDNPGQFDMYRLVRKKSEEYKFPRYVITSYCAAGSVDDALCEKLIAGGYNAVQLDCGDGEGNRAALKKLESYGLYCDAMIDHRLHNLAYANAADYSYEQVRDTVAAVNADYADCPNLLGYFLIDEPNAERFEMLGMLVRAIREVCPDKEGYINLFPSYANGTQLGKPSYESYISSFIATVDPQFLQFDNYTFNLEEFGGQINNASPFFNDLAVIRKWGARFGIDAEIIVQLDRWTSYVDEVGPTQVLWEVNIPLAYGFKRISYFTFFDYTGFTSLHSPNFQERRYEASKTANLKTVKVAEELFGKQSVAVYAFGERDNLEYEVAYTADAGLGTIQSAGRAVIGTFDDGSVYFVNRAAYEGDADTFLLGGYTADLDWFDPTAGVWKDAGECPAMTKSADGWSITLDPAEAVLFRAK